MASRFFINSEQLQGNMAIIKGQDVQHITKVLRLSGGDEIILSAGKGKEYLGRIAALEKESIQVEILGEKEVETEPKVKVTLLQGLPKGDKMDLIVQKCTELGINTIVPITAARSIVKLDRDKALKKRARWQKIAEEAAKQCQRGVIPEIRDVVSLSEALSSLGTQLFIIPWEEEKEQAIKQVLHANREAQEIAVLIGPEGGLSQEEVSTCLKAKGQAVTLGKRILRTETAGFTVLTMILYEFGDLGG